MKILSHAEEKTKKAVTVLEENLETTRTGIAHTSLLDHVQFEYYGSPTPINQMASVKVVEERQLVVKPCDRGTLKDIGRTIQISDTGLAPQSGEEVIRLNVPALTKEHHKELAKFVHRTGEETEIAIRNIRCDANDAVRKDKELAEDLRKDAQKKIQKLTGKIGKSIDSTVDTETKGIMKV